jgi:hypothetical protein
MGKKRGAAPDGDGDVQLGPDRAVELLKVGTIESMLELAREKNERLREENTRLAEEVENQSTSQSDLYTFLNAKLANNYELTAEIEVISSLLSPRGWHSRTEVIVLLIVSTAKTQGRNHCRGTRSRQAQAEHHRS